MAALQKPDVKHSVTPASVAFGAVELSAQMMPTVKAVGLKNYADLQTAGLHSHIK